MTNYKWQYLADFSVDTYPGYTQTMAAKTPSPSENYYHIDPGIGGNTVKTISNNSPWNENTQECINPNWASQYLPNAHGSGYIGHGQGYYSNKLYASQQINYNGAKIYICNSDGTNQKSISITGINGEYSWLWIQNIHEIAANYILVTTGGGAGWKTFRWIMPTTVTTFSTTSAIFYGYGVYVRTPRVPKNRAFMQFDDGEYLWGCGTAPGSITNIGASQIDSNAYTANGYFYPAQWYYDRGDEEFILGLWNGDYKETFAHSYSYTAGSFEFQTFRLRLARPYQPGYGWYIPDYWYMGTDTSEIVWDAGIDEIGEWKDIGESLADTDFPVLVTECGEILRFIDGTGYRFKNKLSEWDYQNCDFYAFCQESENRKYFEKVWYIDEDHIYACCYSAMDGEMYSLKLYKLCVSAVYGFCSCGPITKTAHKTFNRYG